MQSNTPMMEKYWIWKARLNESANQFHHRVDFRVKKTSDQDTGSSGFLAQRPPNQSSMRASASMNNLRQDANDGLGSRATTTTEQDFRFDFCICALLYFTSDLSR